MDNVLVLGSNSFIKKNLIEYLKQSKLNKKIKPYFIEDKSLNNFSLKKLKKNNLFCIVFSGKSGSIQYNLKNGKKIFDYNRKLYLNIFSKLDKFNFKNVFFISASCVYPKNKKILKEKFYGIGPFENSNIFYSKSKVYGSNICRKINKKKNRFYITIVPATIYGKFYKYDKIRSHVLISLLHKFRNLKKIVLWGSGKPLRQFLNIQDLFKAIFFIYEKKPKKEVINVTSSTEISIKNLARKLKKLTKFNGKVIWDLSKPDGIFRKCLNDQYIKNLGWKNSHNLSKDLKILIKK